MGNLGAVRGGGAGGGGGRVDGLEEAEGGSEEVSVGGWDWWAAYGWRSVEIGTVGASGADGCG